MKNKQIPLDARPAEVLAVNSGVRQDNGEPILILTVRQNLPGFQPTDLVFSLEHAERLLVDIRTLLPVLRARRQRKPAPTENEGLRKIMRERRKRKENEDGNA